MNKIKLIAIDGPAASGKSTVGLILAKDLGFLCFDTGIMYRAVTLAALQKGLLICDEAAITDLAEKINIEIKPPSILDGRGVDVIIDGIDVTWDIRLPEVNKYVSPVSAFAGVRTAMTLQQRKIAEQGRIIMLGRDIGTVVIPNADIKIYLDASVEERANRRHLEELSRGKNIPYDEVLSSLKNRDSIDSGREIAPLKIADKAYVVNTDHLSVEEVVEKIKEIIKNV